MMSRLNRRTFLKKSSLFAAGATFAIGGTKSSGRILGANERIRVAVAGLNGRGKSHLAEFTNRKDEVEITWLVDPDTRLFEGTVKRVEQATGDTPRTVQDVRQALDDPNLDAISIATPNHWHALMTIWACQAGKDVYVEKPCSHNVHEGRIAVEMARKHGRIVQHGTQARSNSGWAKVAEVIKSGHYGKLKVAHGYCYKRRGTIGHKSPTNAPDTLDWNIWLGPAPEQPYHGNLVHYNWHWFWDTGNGDIGNQGVHEMDKARWGIPGATLPKSVISLGGRFGYEDQGETPNTQLAIFDYGETQLVFEVRGLPPTSRVDNVFFTEEGAIHGGKFYPRGKKEGEPLPNVEAQLGPGGGNFGNFLAAVRSREVGDLNADILEGHYSSALCHLANVSYQLGEEAPFEPRRQVFPENRYASERLAGLEEHLAKENNLKLSDMNYRLGRVLEIDAETETILNDSQANRLLTRDYRKPFAVPESV